MTAETDAQLVERTQAGDKEAYKELVARYQGHVYGLAYSLVSNWADAQDIAQEAFVRAYCNLDQLKDPARFAGWLRRVTFSVAMSWLRAFRPGLFQQLEGKADLEALQIPDFRPGPPEVAEKRELAEAVMRAVASLPPKYRVPLTMFHLDGLSYQKVADFLDIPLGTAKSLVHRAQEKLRALLPAGIREELTMVQEVFNEHKLPPEFPSKVLDKVPVLAWGRGKECTFVGALEAAMSVTAYPHSYTDLMGWSGLAFRVRWWRWTEQPKWDHSCAVGEFPEEGAAIEKATGWRFQGGWDEKLQKRLARMPRLVAAIDAGLPVVGYDDDWDVAVAYGYEDGGKRVLWRDYHKGDTPHAVPAEKIGPWLQFFERQEEPLSPRDALVESLRIAARNWRRGHGDGGLPRRDYWYGEAALQAWRKDLALADELSADRLSALHGVSRWNFVTLADARAAAEPFLRRHAALLPEQARAAVERAATIYSQEAGMLAAVLDRKDAFVTPSAAEWTADVRRREMEILSDVAAREATAIAELEKALPAGAP